MDVVDVVDVVDVDLVVDLVVDAGVVSAVIASSSPILFVLAASSAWGVSSVTVPFPPVRL